MQTCTAKRLSFRLESSEDGLLTEISTVQNRIGSLNYLILECASVRNETFTILANSGCLERKNILIVMDKSVFNFYTCTY